jgi:hypothetical protein
VFFAVLCSILGLMHYYLWMRLVRDPGLPAAWHQLLSGLIVALYVSIPLTMIVSRTLPRNISQFATAPSYIWLGSMFLLVVAVLAVDVTKWAGLGLERLLDAPLQDPEKRLTMTRVFSFAAMMLGTGTAGLALVEGRRFRVKRVEVPLARLPQSLDGMTIVQLSDVHVGPTLGREFMRDVVRTVNQLAPDLVAITGDLVDGSVERLGPAVSELASLRSRFGTFFVTGNHEYYSGAAEWCQELDSLGVRVLRNERVEIGTGNDTFDLAGVDDLQGSRFGDGHGMDLARALTGRDPSREVVLLAHQPRVVNEARQHGVGLQLSGHTHGGQMWPFSWLVKLQQPVVSGLERIGETWVYVSNGTGYWGPPMRFGAPAEVTQIVLRSAAS